MYFFTVGENKHSNDIIEINQKNALDYCYDIINFNDNTSMNPTEIIFINSKYYIKTKLDIKIDNICCTLDRNIYFKATSDATYLGDKFYLVEILLINSKLTQDLTASDILNKPIVIINNFINNKISKNITIKNINKYSSVKNSNENLIKYEIINFLSKIDIKLTNTDFTISFSNINLADSIINKIKNLYLDIYVQSYFDVYDYLLDNNNDNIKMLDDNLLIMNLNNQNYLIDKPHYVVKLDLNTILSEVIIDNKINKFFKEKQYAKEKLIVGFKLSLTDNKNIEYYKNIYSGMFLRFV